MAPTTLVKERVDAGEWLVRAAEKRKVPLRAALWFYDWDNDRWKLALEERADTTLGLRDFLEALFGAAKSIKQASRRTAAKELLLWDTVVSTSPHPVAQALRPSLGKEKSVARTRLDGAVLYRLEPNQVM